MSDENIDKELNSLVDQLKDTTLVNDHIQSEPENTSPPAQVPTDDQAGLEQYVIQSSGQLINQSLEVMNNVKDYIMASGDPDSISALADLINASSKSIESLNKIVVQNKRSSTTITAKAMDIKSKQVIEDKRNENALIGTREEIFKKVLAQAKVIDVAEDNETNPDLPDQKK